jgi:hypothetical protein
MNQVWRKKTDNEGEPLIENGEFVMELVSETSSIGQQYIQPNWLGLEQALFYSGLRAKAKASANLDQFEFSSLIGAFANGKQGLTSENTLIYLLHAINADWDENDIALLNQLLQENNFTVQYT